MSYEVNFDGLVGPTHHYAGLSFGNVASIRNARIHSHPQKAALQGLSKAARLRDLGLKQAFLPPLRRPRLDVLRSLGFSGSDTTVIERAFRSVPHLVSACYSASSMWVANAATVSPSVDTRDGRVHFTPANLSSKFHRSLEPKQTAANLKAVFPGEAFIHHTPLLPQFGDEGAANHLRLAPRHDSRGLEIFVFGDSVVQEGRPRPKRFPARHMMEAASAIAHTHDLEEGSRVFLQQNPDAIDAGAFHNDVVCVSNENVLFIHEQALLDQSEALKTIRAAWEAMHPGKALVIVEIASSAVTLAQAIQSYLFNSQLVSLPTEDGAPAQMALICPEECREEESVRLEIDRILADPSNPISAVHFFDVRESMQNGGGPACLRLRVVLTEEERAQVHPGVWLTPEKEEALTAWILKHYRDRMKTDDLRDPQLFLDVHAAMDDLERVLGFSLA